MLEFPQFFPTKAKNYNLRAFFLQEVKLQKYSSCSWPDWRLFTGIVRTPADGRTLQVGVQQQQHQQDKALRMANSWPRTIFCFRKSQQQMSGRDDNMLCKAGRKAVSPGISSAHQRPTLKNNRGKHLHRVGFILAVQTGSAGQSALLHCAARAKQAGKKKQTPHLFSIISRDAPTPLFYRTSRIRILALQYSPIPRRQQQQQQQ